MLKLLLMRIQAAAFTAGWQARNYDDESLVVSEAQYMTDRNNDLDLIASMYETGELDLPMVDRIVK